MLLIAVLLLALWFFRASLAAGLVALATLIGGANVTEPARLVLRQGPGFTRVVQGTTPPARATVYQYQPREMVAQEPPTWLGVTTGAAAEQAHPNRLGGLVVRYVVPGSPAARAGLEPEDVLVSMGDQPLWSPYHLRALVRSLPPGSPVKIALIRDGVETVAEPVLERRQE